MTHATSTSPRVVVVGAGLVGLVCAWACSRAGARVTVIDPDPARGATFAAAGMLAAAAETHPTELSLAPLLAAGAQAYPGFVADLAARVDAPTGYRRTATLLVGTDPADRAALANLAQVSAAVGLEVESLSTRQARRHEPLLSPSLAGAFLAPRDHQVDPRALSSALLRGLRARGVPLVTERARSVSGAGVHLGDRVVDADAVVLANALGAGSIGGLPSGLAGAIRPVFGDVVRLGPGPPELRLTGVVRGLVNGRAVYLVPRADGSLVLGASSREDGRQGVSAGSVHDLLHDGLRLVPALGEYEIDEMLARPRPCTADGLPLLGELAPGLVIASGFGRHGILLAPVAAAAVTHLLGLPTPGWATVPALGAVSPHRPTAAHPPEELL